MNIQQRLTFVVLVIGILIMGVALTGCDKTNQAITTARSFIRLCQDSTINVAQNTVSNGTATLTITCKTE